MPVIAVTDHSPEQVFGHLLKTGQAKRVTFVPQSGFLDPAGKYHKHIFVVGTREYDRNASSIRDLHTHVVWVFGHRELLSRYGLDVSTPIENKQPSKAKLVPVGSYLEDLKRRAIANSLFHSMMTFIYTLPSKTHQKPVTAAICTWIYNGGGGTIAKLVDGIPITLSPINRHRLIKILAQPVTSRLCAAFRDINSGRCQTLGEAVLKHDVQIFELGYIQGNVNKVDNIVDARVGNQGVE